LLILLLFERLPIGPQRRYATLRYKFKTLNLDEILHWNEREQATLSVNFVS